jgi:hypothetical protein
MRSVSVLVLSQLICVLMVTLCTLCVWRVFTYAHNYSLKFLCTIQVFGQSERVMSNCSSSPRRSPSPAAAAPRHCFSTDPSFW